MFEEVCWHVRRETVTETFSDRKLTFRSSIKCEGRRPLLLTGFRSLVRFATKENARWFATVAA
jgi:hypothetical protein